MGELAAEPANKVGQPKGPEVSTPETDHAGPAALVDLGARVRASPPDPGANTARLRSIQRMQALAGNAAVRRMLATSPRGPIVQRLWGMDKPPNMPQQAPDLTERINQLKQPEYASFQLRANWTKDGRDGATRLSQSVVDEVKSSGPEAQKQVQANFKTEFDKISDEEKAAVTEFESKSKSTLDSILKVSANKLDDEMHRYGFSEKLDPGGAPGSGTATLSATADMKKLEAAAHELVVADAKVANLQITLQHKYAANHPGGPMEEQQNRDLTTRDVNLDPAFQEATQNYQMLFAKHAATFPILAAYRNNPSELNALSQAGKSPQAAAIAVQPLMDKRRDINTTSENIASGKLSIYGLPNIVTVAKNEQGAPAGSLKARFVDDHVAQVKSDKAAVDMALGAIAAAAMVAATVATAGGAAVVAGAATGVGLGIGAAQLVDSIEQYGAVSAAGNTDLDRAKAISQSDPSLFWLAMDIAMFVTDVAAAGALFKQIAGPVHKLASLRQAAAGGAKISEEQAAKITQVFEQEVQPALNGLPQPGKDKVAAALDPKTPMSSMISAAGKASWTEAGLRHVLGKTATGRKTLAIIDKYGITIATSPTGATWYEGSLKTIYISEATTVDDAMNSLVHEAEHAEWDVTGKSATSGNYAQMDKNLFVQKMCREESAAEAATIRNKYATQTLLDRKVMPAPTEEFYHQGFITQSDALKGSGLSEAEKIALCEKKGENALFEAFMEGKVTNSVDGKPYTEYYGNMWAQKVALEPSPPSGKPPP